MRLTRGLNLGINFTRPSTKNDKVKDTVKGMKHNTEGNHETEDTKTRERGPRLSSAAKRAKILQGNLTV